MPRVRALAASLPGVTAAFVAPDGLGFALTGPTWNERLSEAPHALGVELQFELAPDGPLLDGYYQDGMAVCPEGWSQVFP